jgi:pimeloyl-ACP methyl ester carboxylesterase
MTTVFNRFSPITALTSALTSAPTAILLSFLLSLFCSPPLQALTAKLELEACQPKDGKPPLHGAQCGVLRVAENPRSLEGKTLTLNILRLPAIRDRGAQAVFILAGGPGQAASDLAPMLGYRFHHLQQNHDLVFVDQRGTGESNPLNCSIDEQALNLLEQQEKNRELQTRYQSCLAQTDSDLRYYTTPFAVADLEQVRQALGYQTISLWGASYGTRVGLEYLRRHPQVLHSAVLDGLTPVAIELPRYSDEDSSAALAAIFDRCRNAKPCHQAFPDLADNWLALLDSLASAPIEADLPHPRSQQIETLRLDQAVISGWVRFVLYFRDLTPLLPLAIDKASKGDFSLLYSMASQGSDGIEEGISTLMHMAVICAEDRQFSANMSTTTEPASTKSADSTNIKTTAELIRSDNLEQYQAICQVLPQGHNRAEFFLPVKSEVPTLLLSGTLDPATPPRWAELAAQSLSHSRHLIVDGAHHGVSALGCMPRLISEFFDQGDEHTLDTSCLEKIKPKAFFIDQAGPALSPAVKESGKPPVSDSLRQHDKLKQQDAHL